MEPQRQQGGLETGECGGEIRRIGAEITKPAGAENAVRIHGEQIVGAGREVGGFHKTGREVAAQQTADMPGPHRL